MPNVRGPCFSTCARNPAATRSSASSHVAVRCLPFSRINAILERSLCPLFMACLSHHGTYYALLLMPTSIVSHTMRIASVGCFTSGGRKRILGKNRKNWCVTSRLPAHWLAPQFRELALLLRG